MKNYLDFKSLKISVIRNSSVYVFSSTIKLKTTHDDTALLPLIKRKWKKKQHQQPKKMPTKYVRLETKCLRALNMAQKAGEEENRKEREQDEKLEAQWHRNRKISNFMQCSMLNALKIIIITIRVQCTAHK